jgi:hypothetical protein
MSHPEASPTSAALSPGSRAPSGRPRATPRLLRFEEVELSQPRPDQISCRVTLTGHDRVFIGEGSSVVLNSGQMNAAARATVHAVQAYADFPVKLESCNKTTIAGRDLVLVVLTVPTEPAQDLAGAVVVRGDEPRAAALAVLDATNRWLEMRSRSPVNLS